MKMEDIESQVSFMLGFPANENIEGLSVSEAVNIAFRELKRYIRNSVEKTVPYSTRIKLDDAGIHATQIRSVLPAKPRIGMTLSSIDSGNVFQVAASVNAYSAVGNTTTMNIDPIMTELAMAQVRNVLGTDLQWRWDQYNGVIYIAHRDPIPSFVTIRYVPDLQDVSEITDPAWQDYLIRMSTANMKVALGRSRSKYTIAGSNVTLDGEAILSEGNDELARIREELAANRNFMVVVN